MHAHVVQALLLLVGRLGLVALEAQQLQVGQVVGATRGQARRVLWSTPKADMSSLSLLRRRRGSPHIAQQPFWRRRSSVFSAGVQATRVLRR